MVVVMRDGKKVSARLKLPFCCTVLTIIFCFSKDREKGILYKRFGILESNFPMLPYCRSRHSSTSQCRGPGSIRSVKNRTY